MVELFQTLGSYRDPLVPVGGWAPHFLIDEFGRERYSHIGPMDIDIAVDPELIRNDECSTIVELTEERGYTMRHGRKVSPYFSASHGRPHQGQTDEIT